MLGGFETAPARSSCQNSAVADATEWELIARPPGVTRVD